MGKTTVGFDIGAREVKLALWDGTQVRQLARAPLPENLIQGGRIVSYEAMAELIRAASRKHQLLGKNCAVILPAGQACLLRLTMPAMSVEQLAVNLPYEFRDYLTMGKDQYFYDYAVNHLKRDPDGKPVALDLTAAAVPKGTIAEYREMFRRAGFRLRSAAPPECAYMGLLRAHAAAHPEQANMERCILDIGHTATRVHLYTGARFEATRVIEYGSGAVDAAIARATGVDEHVARTWKETNHEGVQELEGPRSIYGSIAVEIVKAVNFYGFHNRDSHLQDAYFCGGGARIPALLGAISSAVALNLHRITELLPPAAQAGEDLPMFAGAVGIAVE